MDYFVSLRNILHDYLFSGCDLFVKALGDLLAAFWALSCEIGLIALSEFSVFFFLPFHDFVFDCRSDIVLDILWLPFAFILECFVQFGTAFDIELLARALLTFLFLLFLCSIWCQLG